jgi:indolepyruvate decarboxylase
MSKAVISENQPHFVGVFDGKASAQSVQDLVTNADFILALGVWLTDINTLGWSPDLDKTAFISLDTVKIGTYFGAQVSLQHFIDALRAEGISPRNTALPGMPVVPVPEINLDDGITYQGFYDFMPKYITDKTIIGSDASMNYFGSMLLRVGAARGYFAQPSYSSIGFAGAAATGICLAKEADQRVMVFTGDGGFQMTAFCVVTQTRYKLNPIIFVIDNGVFAVEQWLANGGVFSSNGPFKEGLDVYPCSYSKLKDVVDCQGWRVTTYRELDNAIRNALENSKSPSIIQVVVPPKSIPKNARWKTN